MYTVLVFGNEPDLVMSIHRSGTVISGRVKMVSMVEISVVDLIHQFFYFLQVHFVISEHTRRFYQVHSEISEPRKRFPPVHSAISEPTKRSEMKFKYILKTLRFPLSIPTQNNNLDIQ